MRIWTRKSALLQPRTSLGKSLDKDLRHLEAGAGVAEGDDAAVAIRCGQRLAGVLPQNLPISTNADTNYDHMLSLQLISY